MENQKTVTVLKQKDEHFLLHWTENGDKPFVICSDYNPKTKNWISGTYISDITSAVDYFEKEYGNRKIYYDRLVELATLFKDGLIQDDFDNAIEYFTEVLEMEDSEMEWFGINDEIRERQAQEIIYNLEFTDNVDLEDLDEWDKQLFV